MLIYLNCNVASVVLVELKIFIHFMLGVWKSVLPFKILEKSKGCSFLRTGYGFMLETNLRHKTIRKVADFQGNKGGFDLLDSTNTIDQTG